MGDSKLMDKCNILQEMILIISKLYLDPETNPDQKRHIETTLGASLWYLSQSEKIFWTGEISVEAINLLKSNKNKRKLSKDHIFPRKKAAIELLTKEISNLIDSKGKLYDLYKSKYGKFRYVTPEENRRLVNEHKKDNAISIDDAYKFAGISLIKSSSKELSEITKKTSIEQQS